MLISINIISAISIVMGLFIPYFILLHINNTLRKKIESSDYYISIILKQIKNIESTSNENFRGQDKNWELYKDDLDFINKNFGSIKNSLKVGDENFENLNNKLNNLEVLINIKQTLKEILENPIEVKKPTCETKDKLKEELNEPKAKRKYTRKVTKEVAKEAKKNLLTKN